jgi:hypothetical protein
MYFGEMQRAIGQSNASDPFALSPPTASIDPPKPGKFPDARPSCECLDFGNFVHNLEVHQWSVSKPSDCVNGASGSTAHG